VACDIITFTTVPNTITQLQPRLVF
jgi:hypothetical protein